jgi:hypothetical protein
MVPPARCMRIKPSMRASMSEIVHLIMATKMVRRKMVFVSSAPAISDGSMVFAM